MSLGRGGSGVLDLAVAGVHDHVVGVYDRDDDLVRSVAGFLAPAVRGGGVGVIVGTPEHHRAMTAALVGLGVDVAAARRDGRLVVVDAAATLERIATDGTVDPERFEAVVARRIAELGADGREVRVFGELVVLLWEAGHVIGAIDLERLWDELIARTPFSLLCAYPNHLVSGPASADAFAAVCAAHTAIAANGADPHDAAGGGGDDLALRDRLHLVESRRRALLAEIAQLRAEVERADVRDEVLRRYVAMVVHDLRGPAMSVTGFLEMLRGARDTFSPERVDDVLDRALAASGRIERMTDDALAALVGADRFTYRLDDLDLAALVRTSIDQVATRTGRCIELMVDGPLPTVRADPDRQQQIIENLLSNAVKFSPEGRPVSVRLRRRDDVVLVEVHDRGNSLSPEDAAGLFQPYERLARTASAEGTGLGLAISRTLVEGQGGSIWVAPVEGEGAGTRFLYTVPVSPGSDGTPPASR